MASNNTNGGRTDSYTKAINKATGKAEGDAAHEPSDVDAAPLQRGAHAMIKKDLTKADMAAFLAEEGFEYAPQVYTMEPFSRVDGILEGNGPQAELTRKDPISGEQVTQIVDTWIICEPTTGQRISILDTVQLKKKLPPFMGQMVHIFRGDESKTGGGFKTTNYMVRGLPLPDGKKRSFVVPPTSKVIDAKSIETPVVRQIAGGEDAQA
jgi:hypothetical protein